MVVVVDQSRHDRAATQVDQLRARTCERADLGAASDGDETIFRDGERLDDVVSSINRGDRAVVINRVWRQGCGPLRDRGARAQAKDSEGNEGPQLHRQHSMAVPPLGVAHVAAVAKVR